MIFTVSSKYLLINESTLIYLVGANFGKSAYGFRRLVSFSLLYAFWISTQLQSSGTAREFIFSDTKVSPVNRATMPQVSVYGIRFYLRRLVSTYRLRRRMAGSVALAQHHLMSWLPAAATAVLAYMGDIFCTLNPSNGSQRIFPKSTFYARQGRFEIASHLFPLTQIISSSSC